MFVTCFYASLDPKTGQMQYANAGHTLPCRGRAGAVEELCARGMPLGLMLPMRYEEHTMLPEPEDTVLYCTDGMVEAHDPQRKIFGSSRIRELLRDYRLDGERDLIDALLCDLGHFTLHGCLLGTGGRSDVGEDSVAVERWRCPVRQVAAPPLHR
ncbi:MAG: serine/threonine-protein phosphatase [Chloroflexia bacterium]|nr:serine/threonine-protein phosphatase [Chloroflexia bacterium]